MDILYYFCLAKRSPILKNNKNTNSKMKTKLTLLKNALLVGGAAVRTGRHARMTTVWTTRTYDCAGLYEGSLTIREHGTGANNNWLNGSTLSYSAAPLEVTAVSATQLKYEADSIPEVTSTWGYQIAVTVDYVSDGVDMKYFTASGAEYTVDSLKLMVRILTPSTPTATFWLMQNRWVFVLRSEVAKETIRAAWLRIVPTTATRRIRFHLSDIPRPLKKGLFLFPITPIGVVRIRLTS